MELRSFGQDRHPSLPSRIWCRSYRFRCFIGSASKPDPPPSVGLQASVCLIRRAVTVYPRQRLGHFLKQRRHDVVLSTKVGYDVPRRKDWTFQAVAGGIDQALLTMKTDFIDIVHLHSCSKEILAQDDVIEALERAKQAGKVRLIAYSGDRDDLGLCHQDRTIRQFSNVG